MNDYFKRKNVISTDNENTLSFEMRYDDKEEPIGYSTIHLEDIHTLVKENI